MITDAQGHALSGANRVAADLLDEAIRAFTLNYGDANALLNSTASEAPACAMIAILRAWLAALSNDPEQLARARQSVEAIPEANLNERELGHLAALRVAVQGRWATVVAMLDRLLMTYPHDLAAHQIAMRFDGYQGRFAREAARAARALPFWSKDQPGYGILFSFYGFGLEECGDYARAEEISRQAAELEPDGYWPHHAVSHVLEMTGRPSEGVRWMEEREPRWSSPNHTNRVHIWWHKALFHVELGEFDRALELYDREIVPALRPVGTSLCNPTALLWRLESLGCDAGERWQPLWDIWQGHADGRTSPFNDVHYAMTALRATKRAEFDELLVDMQAMAHEDTEVGPAYRLVAVPVVEALAAFDDGRLEEAVERLLPVRAELWRMGGSIAQRDLVDWTLTDAALRAGLPDIGQSLVNERCALRPNSRVNRRFQERANSLGA